MKKAKKKKIKVKFKPHKFQVISEYFVGLAIAWTAGGIGFPFVTQDFSFKGMAPVFLGIVGSLVSLYIAVEYRHKVL